MGYKISPSALNLLEDCPKCFWLQLVKKISRPAGAFPSLPSGVDKLLKEHFDSFMKMKKLPPELEKEGVDAELFSDEKLLAEWRNNFKGIEYLDEESGVLLRGAVDNLLEKNGKLIVLDFKTRGFALKDDTAGHYQTQLDAYNYLLRKNGFDTADYSYLLFYIPEKINSTGEFVFETKLVKMQANPANAETLFKKAVSVLKGEMPEPSKQCAYCKWKEETG